MMKASKERQFFTIAEMQEAFIHGYTLARKTKLCIDPDQEWELNPEYKQHWQKPKKIKINLI